ncbi:MAG: DUF4968 domain-containing protein, partial [Bacteroidales bacterium]|nr:DUF4968 domain-containing protein [Bacteroidales bacterium]
MKKITILISMISCFLSGHAYEQTPHGVTATIGGTNLEIRFYSPQIVRVSKYPAGKPFRDESFSVIKQPENKCFELSQSSNVVLLKSKDLAVSLNLLTGNIAFAASDGSPLLSEKTYSHLSQTFLLDKQEPVYGLGQQQEGRMNRRGDSLLLRQENMKIAIPFFQSVKGYGVFWDNSSATRFVDSPNGLTFTSEAGDGMVYYFLWGRTMDGVVACMRELTGQAPLHPLWTHGYWQSKERYASQKELVETVERYRALGVPLDGIVQDWQYWSTDNTHWNAVEFGNPAFPNPKQMVEDIHGLNAHVAISVWPSFGPNTAIHKDLKKKKLLLNFDTY